MNVPTTADIETFVAKVQAVIVDHYAERGYRNPPRVSVMVGRKYVRLVTDGHSVYGFIGRADGALYKAASWKGPARNFTRGNIADLDLILSPYGIG